MRWEVERAKEEGELPARDLFVRSFALGMGSIRHSSSLLHSVASIRPEPVAGLGVIRRAIIAFISGPEGHLMKMLNWLIWYAVFFFREFN